MIVVFTAIVILGIIVAALAGTGTYRRCVLCGRNLVGRLVDTCDSCRQAAQQRYGRLDTDL